MWAGSIIVCVCLVVVSVCFDYLGYVVLKCRIIDVYFVDGFEVVGKKFGFILG